MSVVEVTIIVIAFALLTAIVLIVFIAAFFGMDLECFDRYRITAPKQYRNLKRVCRFNSPMTAILCIGGMIGTPFMAFAPDCGVLAAMATFVGSAMCLWLSIRWFLWSLRP